MTAGEINYGNQTYNVMRLSGRQAWGWGEGVVKRKPGDTGGRKSTLLVGLVMEHCIPET